MPAELGYKDNFLVKPWEKVKIIIPFGDKREICISLSHIGARKRRDDVTIRNYLMDADKASEIRR